MTQIVGQLPAYGLDLCGIGLHHAAGISDFHHAANLSFNVIKPLEAKGYFVAAAPFVFILQGFNQSGGVAQFENRSIELIFHLILFICPKLVNRFKVIGEKVDFCFIIFTVRGQFIPIHNLISQCGIFPCAAVFVGSGRNRNKEDGEQDNCCNDREPYFLFHIRPP